MAAKCWGKPQKHTVKWHKFKTFFVQFHKMSGLMKIFMSVTLL